MGIITKMGLAVISAGAGFGLCYYLMDKSDRPATYQECRGVYEQNLLQLQDVGRSITPIEGISSPADFRLDYIVSPEKQFNGLIFTDNVTGRQGVITKHHTLGVPQYGFTYADLGDLLKSVYSIQIQPQLPVAIPQPAPVPAAPTPQEQPVAPAVPSAPPPTYQAPLSPPSSPIQPGGTLAPIYQAPPAAPAAPVLPPDPASPTSAPPSVPTHRTAPAPLFMAPPASSPPTTSPSFPSYQPPSSGVASPAPEEGMVDLLKRKIRRTLLD